MSERGRGFFGAQRRMARSKALSRWASLHLADRDAQCPSLPLRTAIVPAGADGPPSHNVTVSQCQTAALVPAARFAPGACFNFARPQTRGERSAEKAHGCSGTRRACRVRRARARISRGRPRHLTRRLASLSGRTRASRRSTVAILGRGPALPSPAFPPDPCSDAPRGQVVVPAGRGP